MITRRKARKWRGSWRAMIFSYRPGHDELFEYLAGRFIRCSSNRGNCECCDHLNECRYLWDYIIVTKAGLGTLHRHWFFIDLLTSIILTHEGDQTN